MGYNAKLRGDLFLFFRGPGPICGVTAWYAFTNCVHESRGNAAGVAGRRGNAPSVNSGWRFSSTLIFPVVLFTTDASAGRNTYQSSFMLNACNPPARSRMYSLIRFAKGWWLTHPSHSTHSGLSFVCMCATVHVGLQFWMQSSSPQ
jgi:hypothetical protein